MTEHYQSSEFENYPDTRVRRAFLWIKVDESIKKKKKKKLKDEMNRERPNKSNINNHKMKYKLKNQRQRSTFRNFFRLWVFRIDDQNLVRTQNSNIFRFFEKKTLLTASNLYQFRNPINKLN